MEVGWGGVVWRGVGGEGEREREREREREGEREGICFACVCVSLSHLSVICPSAHLCLSSS